MKLLIKYIDSGGIRTHEAYASDLESLPFDRSGTLSLPHVGLEPTTSRLEVGCAILLRQ